MLVSIFSWTPWKLLEQAGLYTELYHTFEAAMQGPELVEAQQIYEDDR